ILASMLGGRAAEEIIFGEVSSGAGNDLEKATELARKMVGEWGMSDRLGPVSFGKNNGVVFIGKEIATHRDYSEKTAQEIDAEIRRFVEEAYKKAKSILLKRKDYLIKVAELLQKRETITGEELDRILAGEDIEEIEREKGIEEVKKEGVEGGDVVTADG
ncbi:MAG: cell division protein FtsH, partial [Candidatus Coatesbacteria bacterium 4484_99]